MTTISSTSTSASATTDGTVDGRLDGIAVETDFPVVWDDPAQAQRSWQRDRFHMPDPVPQLAWDVQRGCFVRGMTAALRRYHVPLDIELTRVNTYVYLGLPGGPPTGVDVEAMKAAAAETERLLKEAMARMWPLWEDDLLPQIHAHLTFWEAFDLPGAGLADLAAHLEETLERFTDLLDIHFVAIIPAYLAVSELDECYRQLLDDGSTGAFDAYKLIQGLPNMTVEVGHALWRLSREARQEPEVVTALQAGAGQPAAATFEALAATGAGRAFAAKLRDYLEVYGQRGDKFFDLDRPAWVEEPGPALDTLRSYLTEPDSADPARARAALAAERDEAIAATRARIAGYPAAARAGFEFLLEAATAGVVVTEDHGFWIDFRSAYKVRRVLLEVGARLAAGGVIDGPDDVFMLTLDEVRESLAALLAGGAGPGRRAAVLERRAELEHFTTVRPPDRIGAPPPPPPPVMDPVTRAFSKFSGDPQGGLGTAEERREPGVVKGIPGSPGTVKGVARVIRHLADSHRLQPGEILVTEATTPPWTPLFAVAAGLVSDTGGVLSHTAVVAREYGLPAVVGTVRGTDRILDGMVVEIDGDAGEVRFDEPA